MLSTMASPASISPLRLLAPLSEDERVKAKVPGAFIEPSELALPGYRSGVRDIDTRESWGSEPEDSASTRWLGVRLDHPDHHEPTANLIILAACLLMFAAAMWWGSAQLHDDASPEYSARAVRDAPGRP